MGEEWSKGRDGGWGILNGSFMPLETTLHRPEMVVCEDAQEDKDYRQEG